MLEQLEGSHAVAGAVALCRPEVISRLPDLAPDPHRRGPLRHGANGRPRPCEYLMVESEFGAMSVCIGASAAGARTYTATASQGLLFMAEALYNASGLGLPIVMTVANRAIGAPINIWNDHSDSMSSATRGWIQLFAEDQPGGGRPAHPGVPARRRDLAAGDGLHGRLHPHPRLRAGRPAGPGAGRRVPAAVRAPPGARPGRPDDDRRDGRPGGFHRGQVPDATPSSFRPSTRSRRSPPSSRRTSAASRRPRARVPHRRRRDDRGRARLGPRHDRGRGRRDSGTRA